MPPLRGEVPRRGGGVDARGVKVCALHPSEFADAHPPPLEGEAKKPFGSARRAVDSIASPTRGGALYHSPRCLPYEGCARRRVKVSRAAARGPSGGCRSATDAKHRLLARRLRCPEGAEGWMHRGESQRTVHPSGFADAHPPPLKREAKILSVALVRPPQKKRGGFPPLFIKCGKPPAGRSGREVFRQRSVTAVPDTLTISMPLSEPSTS